MDAMKQAFQRGMIILWSGLIADIPGGWHLCDGTAGTPNLENSFVVGAGDTYVVGATGGSVNHLHSGVTAGHDHSIMAPGTSVMAGSDYDYLTDQSTDSLIIDPTSNLPPYYALAYIMKL